MMAMGSPGVEPESIKPLPITVDLTGGVQTGHHGSSNV